MLKRLLGVLILISLLTPPFLAWATVSTAQGIANDLDAAARQRWTAIHTEAGVIVTEVEALRASLNEVTKTLNSIKQSIANTLNSIASLPNQISIPEIQLPRIDIPAIVVPIPDIPAFNILTLDLGVIGKFPIRFPGFAIPDVNLKIPAFDLPRIPAFSISVPFLNDIKAFLRDAFSNLNQIIDGVINVTGIQRITDSAGKIATEVQGFGGDLQTISSTWSEPIRRLGLIFAAWVVVVWVVLIVGYLKKAVDLLRGR